MGRTDLLMKCMKQQEIKERTCKFQKKEQIIGKKTTNERIKERKNKLPMYNETTWQINE